MPQLPLARCHTEAVSHTPVAASGRFVIRPEQLDDLITVLRDEGYETWGTTVKDRVVTIAPITSRDELPRGWVDHQDAGFYRAEHTGTGAYFGFANPASTWKSVVFPPRTMLWRSRRAGRRTTIEEAEEAPPRRAFIGIRGCDLAAIAVQDRVFLDRGYPDPHYEDRREGVFFVGVDCATPAASCFCASMGTGPAVRSGADLTFTELDPDDPGRHRFLAVAHTPKGRRVAGRLPHTAVTAEDLPAAQRVRAAAEAALVRHVETTGLPQLLRDAVDHPRWQEVAQRCLSCANCTLACPTCFCFDVTDEPNVVTGQDERVRRWGSCFERAHSYLHGGSVRRSPKSRYRQWMTHKLSTWWEQFDTSGCVGCGRCITWCPVGIDITEEVAAFQAAPDATGPRPTRREPG